MIQNKISEAALETLDLLSLAPLNNILEFDIKPFLYQELILKEKDFRQQIKDFNFEPFRHKIVAVFCSVDAIVPVWAFMIIAHFLENVHAESYFGDKETIVNQIILNRITTLKSENYQDKRVVVKGCGHLALNPEVYMAITQFLKPVAKSIFYGEPCSTVPIFKRQINF